MKSFNVENKHGGESAEKPVVLKRKSSATTGHNAVCGGGLGAMSTVIMEERESMCGADVAHMTQQSVSPIVGGRFKSTVTEVDDDNNEDIIMTTATLVVCHHMAFSPLP
jgi:hypothetical protein